MARHLGERSETASSQHDMTMEGSKNVACGSQGVMGCDGVVLGVMGCDGCHEETSRFSVAPVVATCRLPSSPKVDCV